MSSMLFIDLLLEHNSLITLRGQITDLGNIFNAGCLAIRASRSTKSFASRKCCMSVGKARFLTVRFLASTETDVTVSSV